MAGTFSNSSQYAELVSRIDNSLSVGFIGRLKAISIFMLIFVVLPSPVLHHLLGLNVKLFFAMVTLGLILVLYTKINYSYSLQSALVATALLTLAVCGSLFSNSVSQLMLGIVLLIMYSLSGSIVRFPYIQRSLKFAFYFTVTLLIGGWIGLIYSLVGGDAQLCMNNPDGRLNCLYLTTFSNTESLAFWRIIRPAGLFDEPGALSFFTILMVCLNELHGGGRVKSFVLLFLGLATLSLAHFLCLIIYSMLVFKKYILRVILVGTIVMGLAWKYIPEDSFLYLNFLQRFTITEDGGLHGDNRSGQVKAFFSVLDNNISQYGNNVIIQSGGKDSEVEDQSANPFSIWFSYGVLMWLPYVMTLAVIFFNIFSRNLAVKITSVLLIFLLLQRPYIYSMYWGYAIWVVIAVMLLKKKTKTTRLVRCCQEVEKPIDATSV